MPQTMSLFEWINDPPQSTIPRNDLINFARFLESVGGLLEMAEKAWQAAYRTHIESKEQ